jgi:hypothetical protein
VAFAAQGLNGEEKETGTMSEGQAELKYSAKRGHVIQEKGVEDYVPDVSLLRLVAQCLGDESPLVRLRAVEVLSSQAYVQENNPPVLASPVRPEKSAQEALAPDASSLLEHNHASGVSSRTCELCRWEKARESERARTRERDRQRARDSRRDEDEDDDENPTLDAAAAAVLSKFSHQGKTPKVFAGFPRHPCTLRQSVKRTARARDLSASFSRHDLSMKELLGEAPKEKKESSKARTRGDGSGRGKRQKGEYDTLLSTKQIEALAAGVCVCVRVHAHAHAHAICLSICLHAFVYARHTITLVYSRTCASIC